MRAAARVIAEAHHDQWIAYFGDEPHAAVFGEDPGRAILRLLDTIGRGHFQESELHRIDEATREGHVEFLATFKQVQRSA